MTEPLQIGLLVFPKVTQLDLTGPLQVFSSVPGAKVHLIWKRIEPVQTDSVMVLTPTTTFADCPQLDVSEPRAPSTPAGAASEIDWSTPLDDTNHHRARRQPCVP